MTMKRAIGGADGMEEKGRMKYSFVEEAFADYGTEG
jgi:hypothetical protein